jgi:butyryl-CoA dehydrogenase
MDGHDAADRAAGRLDVGALRSKAERAADGSYRITGSKIFITYGEHDLTDNIIHFVLARCPMRRRHQGDLALPRSEVFRDDDGTLGARNDARCHSVEHKLGIHGSPTCTMVYGDKDGAVGWLIGEENRGLNCMFTMMNNARLAVGLQGVAIAERATQQAFAYAQGRRQGRRREALEPDHRASRMCAHAAHHAGADPRRARDLLRDGRRDRSRAPRQGRGGAQGGGPARLAAHAGGESVSTDIGVEVASLGVQVHGGMGFVEETGAAQHYRDARIAPIYEGHQRHPGDRSGHAAKLPMAGGACGARAISTMRSPRVRR